MDTEVRQLLNAALRSYELAKNSAFRRLNSSISRALALDESEGRRAIDDAWRTYIDEMQEASAPFSIMLERISRH
mgnify:CR=1 FL=1